MPIWLSWALMIAGYILLMKWVLPWFGIPT